MKKFLKFLALLLVGLLCCCSLFGCAKEEPAQSGPIPNGIYATISSIDTDTYVYGYVENENGDHYWEILGYEAQSFSSSVFPVQRAKIVEKDGQIYFECYKWDNFFFNFLQKLSGKELKKKGSTDIYIVEYNAEEKSITVELYKKGE